MRSLTLPMLVLCSSFGMPVHAATDTPVQVVTRHVQAVAAGDVGAVKVREFYDGLMVSKNMPALSSMVSTTEIVSPDVVLLRWTQFKGTPQERNGTDVFVVRRGKIVFQSVRPE